MADTAVTASTLCSTESQTLTSHELSDNCPAPDHARLCVTIGIIAAHPNSLWPEVEMEDLLVLLRKGEQEAALRAKVIAGIWLTLTGRKIPGQRARPAADCIPVVEVPQHLLSDSLGARLKIA